jgi:hypothetical protein
MTPEELEAAQQVLALLFDKVLSEVPEILELAGAVRSEAIDVRVLLTSLVDGSRQSKAQAIWKTVSENYEKLNDKIQECTSAGAQLLRMYDDNDYRGKIERHRLGVKQDQAAKALARAQGALAYLKTHKMGRQLTWSGCFINLFNMLRGLDRAQAVLLKRKPRSEGLAESFWKITKGAASDGASTIVPFLGTLVAMADAQTPEIDKQLDALSKASEALDVVFKFDEIVLEHIRAGESTLALFYHALEDEARMSKQFSETLAIIK